MALRIIRKNGEAILRQQSKEVKKITPALVRLLEDMAETMEAAVGVGLAAPQVGVGKRIIVVKHDCDTVLELINPVILKATGTEIGNEGCLSCPGLSGEVERAAEVEVEGLNREGKKIRINAEGLLARILQHEIDHLNGILFIDKATSISDESALVKRTGRA